MGHNVSSNKIVVSPIKIPHCNSSGNDLDGVNSSAVVTSHDLYGVYNSGNRFKRAAEINVKVETDSRICNITGCCLLPDGSVIMSDLTNKRLKKMNKKKQVSYVTLPDQPTDVCYLGKSENKVAVCGGQSLHFVNVRGNMKLSRSLTLDHICNGLSFHGDNLYIVDETSVFKYSVTGVRIGTLYSSTNSKFCHICVSANGDRLYVTDERCGLVTIDKAGRLLETFADQDLKEAQGICVANDGNLLVSGFESDTVVKVDSCGRNKIETVIQDNGDICDPKCMCVDNHNSKLYVGQWDDKLAVFDMK